MTARPNATASSLELEPRSFFLRPIQYRLVNYPKNLNFLSPFFCFFWDGEGLLVGHSRLPAPQLNVPDTDIPRQLS